MIVGAVGVITLKQPVHAALSLVGTLLTLATIYVGLEAHFLASIQVIVYAGAIMVLFLFVIMLLNVQQDPGLGAFTWLRPLAYMLAGVVGIALIAAVTSAPRALPDAAIIQSTLDGGSPDAIGTALFSEFVLAFQLVGVLLLTGIIGAVSLVERKASQVADASAPQQEQVLETVGS